MQGLQSFYNANIADNAIDQALDVWEKLLKTTTRRIPDSVKDQLKQGQLQVQSINDLLGLRMLLACTKGISEQTINGQPLLVAGRPKPLPKTSFETSKANANSSIVETDSPRVPKMSACLVYSGPNLDLFFDELLDAGGKLIDVDTEGNIIGFKESQTNNDNVQTKIQAQVIALELKVVEAKFPGINNDYQRCLKDNCKPAEYIFIAFKNWRGEYENDLFGNMDFATISGQEYDPNSVLESKITSQTQAQIAAQEALALKAGGHIQRQPSISAETDTGQKEVVRIVIPEAKAVSDLGLEESEFQAFLKESELISLIIPELINAVGLQPLFDIIHLIQQTTALKKEIQKLVKKNTSWETVDPKTTAGGLIQQKNICDSDITILKTQLEEKISKSEHLMYILREKFPTLDKFFKENSQVEKIDITKLIDLITRLLRKSQLVEGTNFAFDITASDALDGQEIPEPWQDDVDSEEIRTPSTVWVTITAGDNIITPLLSSGLVIPHQYQKLGLLEPEPVVLNEYHNPEYIFNNGYLCLRTSDESVEAITHLPLKNLLKAIRNKAGKLYEDLEINLIRSEQVDKVLQGNSLSGVLEKTKSSNLGDLRGTFTSLR